MGKQPALIIKRDPEGLKGLVYDYKLMMSLTRLASESSKLYVNLNKIRYDVELRRNINLELELRRAVMTHYFD